MKKRKPPILLASILVVLVGAIAIINGRSAPPSEDSPISDSEVLAQSRTESETKESLAARVKGTVGGEESHKRMPAGAASGDPVILAPKQSKYVPKPGENATTTQFYRKEAGIR